MVTASNLSHVNMRNSPHLQTSRDLGFWQDGDPTGPSIVSKLVNVAYWERQCPFWFPEEDGVSIPSKSGISAVNQKYDGWHLR